MNLTDAIKLQNRLVDVNSSPNIIFIFSKKAAFPSKNQGRKTVVQGSYLKERTIKKTKKFSTHTSILFLAATFWKDFSPSVFKKQMPYI